MTGYTRRSVLGLVGATTVGGLADLPAAAEGGSSAAADETVPYDVLVMDHADGAEPILLVVHHVDDAGRERAYARRYDPPETEARDALEFAPETDHVLSVRGAHSGTPAAEVELPPGGLASYEAVVVTRLPDGELETTMSVL